MNGGRASYSSHIFTVTNTKPHYRKISQNHTLMAKKASLMWTLLIFSHGKNRLVGAPTRERTRTWTRVCAVRSRRRASGRADERRDGSVRTFFYSFRTSILQRSFHVASRIPIPIRIPIRIAPVGSSASAEDDDDARCRRRDDARRRRRRRGAGKWMIKILYRRRPRSVAASRVVARRRRR